MLFYALYLREKWLFHMALGFLLYYDKFYLLLESFGEGGEGTWNKQYFSHFKFSQLLYKSHSLTPFSNITLQQDPK